MRLDRKCDDLIIPKTEGGATGSNREDFPLKTRVAGHWNWPATGALLYTHECFRFSSGSQHQDLWPATATINHLMLFKFLARALVRFSGLSVCCVLGPKPPFPTKRKTSLCPRFRKNKMKHFRVKCIISKWQIDTFWMSVSGFCFCLDVSGSPVCA